MTEELLVRVVENLNHRNLNLFFRSRCENYAEGTEDLNLYNDEGFSEFQKLGEIRFDSGEKLIVASSLVKDDLTERSGKKAQYDQAKRILKDLQIYDAGFFVFHDASGDFRFSLIYAQFQGVKRTFSNFRRFTYFVSKDQTNKTFLKRVGECNYFNLETIKDAFSVEKVNKEFYGHIARFFYRLTGYNHPREMKLPSVPDEDKKTYQEFAVRLIGRAIFCWFLKHKRSPNGESLIPESILSSKAVRQNSQYYHSVLEKLFFEVLNTQIKERKGDIFDNADKIPFLNGGLFEPHKDDFNEPSLINALKIPDEWFEQFFEILEQYNFTIDENSTVDADVSVDPEMLGRIFENLLAEVNPETGETARKATGSYYTPRTIVDYMVDQSLKQYLLTKTGIDEDRITGLLSYEAEDVSLIDTEKDSVISALDEIKIIDPACGSGAFPMGILHKMLLVLQKVDPDLSIWLKNHLGSIEPGVFRDKLLERIKNENWEYVRKLLIIQNSIYGVDIQTIAVEISKLRFFLSLIVDEQIDDARENSGIEALPNLEFKFVAANSLIGLPPVINRQVGLGVVSEEITRLKELRDRYLRSYGKEKKEIEEDFRQTRGKLIEQTIKWGGKDVLALQLANWDPFSNEACDWFDPEWMFGEKEFDLAIANPPWGVKLNTNERASILTKLNIDKSLDSSEVFIFLANSLITRNRILCFIVPKSIIFANNWSTSRNFILQNKLLNLGDCGISFQATNLESIVLIFCSSDDYQSDVEIVRFEPIKRFSETKEVTNLSSVNQKLMIKSDALIVADLSPGVQKLVGKIQGKSIFLSNIEREVYRGLYIPDSRKAHILDKGSYLYVNKVPDVSMYSLDRVRKIDLSRYLKDYSQIIQKLSIDRIIIKVLRGQRLTCAFARRNVLTTEKLVNLVIKEKNVSPFYMLALLNSKLNSFYLSKAVFSDITETSRVMDDCYLSKCPVVLIDSTSQQPFINVVNNILNITDNADYLTNPDKQTKVKECEHQIDQMVYELYGLTPEEIEIVEGSTK